MVSRWGIVTEQELREHAWVCNVVSCDSQVTTS